MDQPIVKPRLVPMKVPWQICRDTPYLTLRVSEAADEIPPQIEFQADYLPEDNRRGPFQLRLIVVTFEGHTAFRLLPEHPSGNPLNEDAYDWSEVPLSLPAGNERLESWSARRKKRWREAGNAPDPNFYEVQGDPWLAEIIEGDPAFKQYMAVGHDCYIEVIATGWKWETKKILADKLPLDIKIEGLDQD